MNAETWPRKFPPEQFWGSSPISFGREFFASSACSVDLQVGPKIKPYRLKREAEKEKRSRKIKNNAPYFRVDLTEVGGKELYQKYHGHVFQIAEGVGIHFVIEIGNLTFFVTPLDKLENNIYATDTLPEKEILEAHSQRIENFIHDFLDDPEGFGDPDSGCLDLGHTKIPGKIRRLMGCVRLSTKRVSEPKDEKRNQEVEAVLDLMKKAAQDISKKGKNNVKNSTSISSRIAKLVPKKIVSRVERVLKRKELRTQKEKFIKNLESTSRAIAAEERRIVQKKEKGFKERIASISLQSSFTTSYPTMSHLEPQMQEPEDLLALTEEMIGGFGNRVQENENGRAKDEDLSELVARVKALVEELEKKSGAKILPFLVGVEKSEAQEKLEFEFGEKVAYTTCADKLVTKYFVGKSSKGGAILSHNPPGSDNSSGNLEGLSCFAISPKNNHRVEKIQHAAAAE